MQYIRAKEEGRSRERTLSTKNFGRFNFRTRFASEKLKRPKFLVSEN